MAVKAGSQASIREKGHFALPGIRCPLVLGREMKHGIETGGAKRALEIAQVG
jgi:hypothetical protein